MLKTKTPKNLSMTSTNKTTNQEKPAPPNSPLHRSKTHPPRPSLSAMDKAQAVLAVWTDRCKGSEVCRQLNINWMTFNQWQQRAIEGMLQALESRVNLAQGEALSPRLKALLQKQQRSLNLSKISSRLEQLQQNKIASPPSDPAKAAA